MAHGIEVINKFGNVIFADSLSGLYFHGKANVFSMTTPNWGTDNNAGQMTFVTYAITTDQQFIVPFIEQKFGLLFSLIRCFKSGGVYFIDVVFSGNVQNPPECYVFSKAMIVTNDNYGLQAFRSDGSVAFDSRCKYLEVRSAKNITHQPLESVGQLSAASGSVSNILNSGYDNWRWYGDQYSARESLTASSINYTFTSKAIKPIVFFPSLGVAFKQVNWKYIHTDYMQNKRLTWSIYNNYSYSRNYTDWALYRQAVCVTPYSIKEGWVPISVGQNYTTGPGQWVNGGLMEWHTSPVSIFTQFGKNIGHIPYVNQSINIMPITAIVSDGQIYDL